MATVLSVAMMLKYSLRQPDLAAKVERAVKQSIESGVQTRDIGGSASTEEVGDAIARELETLLKS